MTQTNLTDCKTTSRNGFDVVDCGSFLFVKAREKKRALKKVAKVFGNNPILINNNALEKDVFCGKVRLYEKTDMALCLALIEKVCRVTAEKYNIELPLDEIVIVTENNLVHPLISNLLNICRMFTVVSEVTDRQLADEMYFKYGCIIRFKCNSDDFSGENNFVICAANNCLADLENSIVVNLTEKSVEGSNIINLNEISIKDSSISSVCKCWGGSSGIGLYSLMRAIPGEDVCINLNRRADKIFLLDMDAF